MPSWRPRSSAGTFAALPKHDLPTPNLVLDQQVFERNLKTMADHCKRTGINLRAHVKVHRSAEIGKRQIETGSIGLCCATISECELMMDTGLPGILWTCQPVVRTSSAASPRLPRKDPSFMFAVEDPIIVDQLQELAAAEKVTFNVVVDHDIGIGRQGVLPGREGLELSQRIMKAKNLHLAGLMGYSGAASHEKGWPARKQVSEEEVGILMEFRSSLPQSRHPGRDRHRRQHRLLQHRQRSQRRLDRVASWFPTLAWTPTTAASAAKTVTKPTTTSGIALTVLTTVISTHYSKKATIDAGNKSMTQPTDMVKGRPDLRVKRAGAEYGKLEWDHADREPKLGDQVELVLSNLDMSVNCFDRMFVCRGDEVVDVYAVLGRQGPSQR